MTQSVMMRESVSHPNTPKRRRNSRMQWCVLVGVGGLTILTGIGVLIALMSPENLQSAPTVALVSVLVLLCVPVPVLMLERSHRRAGVGVGGIGGIGVVSGVAEPEERNTRPLVAHQSHQPHDSSPDGHWSLRTTAKRKQSPQNI